MKKKEFLVFAKDVACKFFSDFVEASAFADETAEQFPGQEIFILTCLYVVKAEPGTKKLHIYNQ